MKYSVFFIIISYIAVSSCKSGDAANADISKTPHLKTAAFSTGELINYEYNKAGRVSKVTNSIKGRYEYKYGDDEVTETFYDTSGTLKFTKKYRLNKDGLASNETTVDPANEKEKIYLYNPAQQVTTETIKEGENRQTTSYAYTSELLDSMEKRNNDYKLLHQQVYTYYPEINNTAYTYTECLHFRGRQSPKAVKQATWIFYNAGGTEQDRQVYDYTYETDTEKRITKAVVKNAGKEVVAISYTYY